MSDPSDEEVERSSFGTVVIVAGFAVAVAALLGFLAGSSLRDDAPGDDSAEAGFARDMAIHHAQAVEMAEIVRDRTTDPAIRLLTSDIALTQQSQIGRFQGWLDAWGLPATGADDPMTWTGHPTSGRMPGMASPEDVASLETLAPDEMDVRFLQLMIPHHQAGVLMADAIMDVTDVPEVEALARGISESQAAEIEFMRELLTERGAVETEPEVTLPGDH
jgi:uncharacterized protein (DUF305 family)